MNPEHISTETNARGSVADAVRDHLKAAAVADPNPWLQAALGLGYSAVWRKLSGDAAWTLDDLALVAGKQSIGLGALLRDLGCRLDNAITAAVSIHGSNVDASVVLAGGQARDNTTPEALVAVERGGHWMVVCRDQVAAGERYHSVTSLVISAGAARKPRVAVIDDNVDICETAAQVLCSTSAMDVSVYVDPAALLASDATGFDAYVFDWRFPRSTAEAAIQRLREFDPLRRKPVWIVTGEAASEGGDVEKALTRVVREFGCKTKEKPIRWVLLREEILQELQEAARA